MNLMMRSANRFLTTPIQRDPDRWLYKKIIAYVKCMIENRQNAYSNYFSALKCQSDYSPEPPCYLNKFEKFNVEQAFKLMQQIKKLVPPESVSQRSSYLQSLINEHRTAKKERREYTKYIQSLDNGRELKPFDEEASIKRLEKMRKDQQAILARKYEDELNRKKMEHETKKAARKMKNQQMQKKLREKINADKRTIETIEVASESASQQNQDKSADKRGTSRKPKNPKKK